MTANLSMEIRIEHATTLKLLDVLEHNLEVFGAADQVDWDIVDDIIAYCRGYPQTCYHPKEDAIYRRMCERDHKKAEGAGDSLAGHDRLDDLGGQLAHAVEAIRREAEISRTAVHGLVPSIMIA